MSVFVKGLFYLSVVLFFTCNGGAKDKGLTKNKAVVPTVTSISSNYKEVKNLDLKSNYDIDDKVQELDIKYHELLIKIIYIDDRAYLSVENNNKVYFSWKPFQINFYHNSSIDNAEKDIRLLLNDNQTNTGYLLFPAFTEQFSSYFVYHFDDGTLNYLGNYDCNSFNKGSFFYDESQNELYNVSSNKKHQLIKVQEEEGGNNNNLEEDLKILNNRVATKHTTAAALKDWEGIYLNSDDKSLKTYQSILDVIGWFKLKITRDKIVFSSDFRMSTEFPTAAPGGYYFESTCDYNITDKGNTINIYSQKFDATTRVASVVTNNKSNLMLTLYKKDGEYHAVSLYIEESEKMGNSARLISGPPYRFYKFSLEEEEK